MQGQSEKTCQFCLLLLEDNAKSAMPNGGSVHNQERRTSSNGFICSHFRWRTAALLAVHINGMAAA